jgi:hypothetical protein
VTAPVGSVDVELELIARAAARFPDVVVRDELDNNLTNELPTMQIQVVGGSDDGIRLDRALVDIDVYHSTRAERASQLGQRDGRDRPDRDYLPAGGPPLREHSAPSRRGYLRNLLSSGLLTGWARAGPW